MSDMKMIKMSVVVPVYNAHKHLAECLDSILNQTLKEIEIICVNDGSTDKSLCILENYSDKFHNVVIISQSNSGAGKARNIGIDKAGGEYVCFMDSDDFYPESDILECLYETAKIQNVNICGGSFCSLTDGEISNQYNEDSCYSVFIEDKLIKYRNYQWKYGFTRFCYKLSFIKDNAIYFPLYTRFEDPPFMVKAMICADEFYAIRKTVYCYRTSGHLHMLTPIMLCDILRGVGDILDMSQESKLEKLHIGAVQCIDDFKVPLTRYILEGYKEIYNVLCEINCKISFDLVQNKISINLLDKLEKNIELFFKEKLIRDYFIQYKNIAIYNIDEIAMNLLSYIKSVNIFSNMCFYIWADAKQQIEIENTKIFTINELKECKSEWVMVLVILDNTYQKLHETLKMLGFENIVVLDVEMYQWLVQSRWDL